MGLGLTQLVLYSETDRDHDLDTKNQDFLTSLSLNTSTQKLCSFVVMTTNQSHSNRIDIENGPFENVRLYCIQHMSQIFPKIQTFLLLFRSY